MGFLDDFFGITKTKTHSDGSSTTHHYNATNGSMKNHSHVAVHKNSSGKSTGANAVGPKESRNHSKGSGNIRSWRK